jgi:hypothetical protein
MTGFTMNSAPHALRGAPQEFTDECQAHAMALIAEHGLRACEMPRKAAALHEAGHAVIGGALGLPVTRCEVERRRDLERATGLAAWGGWTTHELPEHRLNASSPIETDAVYAAFTFAGWRAECLFAGDALREASSLDERHAVMAACVLIGQKTGRHPAEALCDLTSVVDATLMQNAATVHAIGRSLMTRKAVEGRWLAERLRGVTPLEKLQAVGG